MEVRFTFRCSVGIKGENLKEIKEKWYSMNLLSDEAIANNGEFIELVSTERIDDGSFKEVDIDDTPLELGVSLCTFVEDCDDNEGGYYAEIAIIDESDGEELTDAVDAVTIHKEDLVGLDGDEKYTKARDIATEYMLSVKNKLIEWFLDCKLDSHQII